MTATLDQWTVSLRVGGGNRCVLFFLNPRMSGLVVAGNQTA